MLRFVLCRLFVSVCLAWGLAWAALGAEPPHGNGWRGPHRDGVAASFTAPKIWPQQLTKRWQVDVGTGHSSPVVFQGRIYQFSRQDEQEVLRCLNFHGKEQWKQSYDAPYKVNNAARGHGKGPKSTPWAADDRVFTLGIAGAFQCRRSSDGKLLWQAGDDLPQGSPLYGAATSPLVLGGRLCVIHLGKHSRGALVAFDTVEGKVQWAWDQDGPAYASPVAMNFGNTPQIVTQSQNFCISLSPGGKLLWKMPFKTGFDQNIVTPLQYKDTVIFSGFRKGVGAFRPTKQGDDWTAAEVWHNDEVSMYMNSPIVVGDRLFGFSEKNKGQLYCLDAATGETIWLGPPRQGGNAALLVAGDAIAALLTDGRLIFLSAASDRYQPLAEYQVSESQTWAHPALQEAKVLVKDESSLTMWSFD